MSSAEYSTVYPKYHYKFQPIAKLNQVPPEQDTWYTALDETGGLRIKYLVIRQINDDATNKNIDVRMTIDGISIDATVKSQDNNTFYYWLIGAGVERVSGDTTSWALYLYEALKCEEALIEIRTTSAPGTNQKLQGRIHFEKLERVQS